MKILEENTGSNFSNISHSNFFLNIFPEAREIETKINYWDVKIKIFCTEKKRTKKNERQPIE